MKINRVGMALLALFFFILLSGNINAQQTNQSVDLNGELSVIHADDFAHPENSKYIFYLNVDGKRYELQSGKQLPVVISGTPANVKGNVVGNKIYVQNLAINPASANSAPALSLEEQKVLTQSNAQDTTNTPSSFKLNWFYVAAPGLLIVLFLGYLEIKRTVEHRGLMAYHRQQKNLALRNYVAANLRKGFGKGQIRNALAKNNYNNHEIEEAFRGIK